MAQPEIDWWYSINVPSWEWECDKTSDLVASTSTLVYRRVTPGMVQKENNHIKAENAGLQVILEEYRVFIEELRSTVEQQDLVILEFIRQIQQLEAQQELEVLRTKVAELTRTLSETDHNLNAEKKTNEANKNMQETQIWAFKRKLLNLEQIVNERPQVQWMIMRSVPIDRYVSFVKQLIEVLHAR